MNRTLQSPPATQPPRRPNNDSFKPALRFPTDPDNPNVLPTSVKQVVGSAGPSPTPSQSNLLQSRRKPWEVDLGSIEAQLAKATGGKVVVILGDPPARHLQPILLSTYLQGSLVIVITTSSTDLFVAPEKCVPAVRVLRLRAVVSSPQPDNDPARSAAGTPNLAEPFTAVRLNSTLDWANRVAVVWRADSASQPLFAILDEESPISPTPSKGWGRKDKRQSQQAPRNVSSASNPDSDMEKKSSAWASRFVALNSRSSSVGSFSSNGQSLAVDSAVTSPGPSRVISGPISLPSFRPSSSPAASGIRSKLTSPTPESPKHASSVGLGQPSPNPPRAPSRQLSRRFSFMALTPKSSPADAPQATIPTSSGSSDADAAIDIVINFLPPVSAKGTDGTFGQGKIATAHLITTYHKVLLRQTTLVTMTSQNYLLPVVLPPLRGGGRFGGIQHKRPVTPQASISAPVLVTSTKRWSVVAGLFGIGPKAKAMNPVSDRPQGKRPAPPPHSRSSSSEKTPRFPPPPRHPAVSGTRTPPLPSQSHIPSPKLIHVLPFGAVLNSSSVGASHARVIRSLEAFLLSWCFSTPKDENGEIDQERAKRSLRPFLLDTYSLNDTLKSPTSERQWSILNLVLSGALDDEYPVSRTTSPTTNSPSSIPGLIVTRASTDIHPSEGAPRLRSTKSEAGHLQSSHSGESLPESAGAAPWAFRRAWLGRPADLLLFDDGVKTTMSPSSSLDGISRPAPSTVEPKPNRGPSFDLPSKPPTALPSKPTSSISPSKSRSVSVSIVQDPGEARFSSAKVPELNNSQTGPPDAAERWMNRATKKAHSDQDHGSVVSYSSRSPRTELARTPALESGNRPSNRLQLTHAKSASDGGDHMKTKARVQAPEGAMVRIRRSADEPRPPFNGQSTPSTRSNSVKSPISASQSTTPTRQSSKSDRTSPQTSGTHSNPRSLDGHVQLKDLPRLPSEAFRDIDLDKTQVDGTHSQKSPRDGKTRTSPSDEGKSGYFEGPRTTPQRPQDRSYPPISGGIGKRSQSVSPATKAEPFVVIVNGHRRHRTTSNGGSIPTPLSKSSSEVPRRTSTDEHNAEKPISKSSKHRVQATA